MEKLARRNRAEVLDVLAERYVFERAGVELYDVLLDKLRMSHDTNARRTLAQMGRHRDEEAEHRDWLERTLRELGGDPDLPTEHSTLVLRESRGLEEVVKQDAELPHLFHALLAAELVDNAGWDLLVALADEAGDGRAKRAFRKRLREEADHLLYVRRVVKQLSFNTVLDEERRMPRSSRAAWFP